ncbi:MAG: gamma carbonic anhydrase family protein [Pseudobdellovibrionaceae bacterium]
MILPVRGFEPKIANDAYIAPNAAIIGDVEIGEKSSVWFGVTIRGDVMPIRIGKETNIQDNSVIHGTYGKCGATLHDRVTIGHGVILHGCEVEYGCLIGMGSILMDGSHIGARSIVGAGSLVTEGSRFPANSLILGRPAKVVRSLKPEEIDLLEKSADNYLQYMSWY